MFLGVIFETVAAKTRREYDSEEKINKK